MAGYSEPANYIAYAVPIFMVGIVVEALVARRRGVRAYRIGPTVSDLGCGMVSQVAELFFRGVGLWVFAWLYDHARLVTFEDGSVVKWIVAFVGVDLGFYWWHRASHVVSWLWAVHGVHHQSEDFNYAVALRQPAFESLTAFPFYAPLALVGVDPLTFAICYAANLTYQFFTHTELVGRLGPLEWVFNTPSHHRVHHGINPRYLDKNYAGVFIVWDRIFGTFEPEAEPAVYGVTKPLREFDPVWANFAIFRDIGRVARATGSFLRRLYVPWAHPAYQPDGSLAEPKPVDRATFERFDPHPPPNVRRYVYVHLVLALAQSGTIAQLHLEGVPPLRLLPLGIALVVGLSALAAYVELAPRAKILDAVRYLILAPAVYELAVRSAGPAVAAAAALSVLLLGLVLAVAFRPWQAAAPRTA
ncbi:MAG: fatty acid hydroxylase family protein [Deltaproteobacteria bacterium]|nr:MAG: fatty acid hydroxylase family protein [Deltaproteobacteria bacterium]